MMGNSANIRRRRRGQQLQAALLETAWDELVEVGYAKLTMESVAARARTGIAVLYRRWPNKDELVLAAIEHRRNSRPLDIPDTGALRGDLIATLTRMVDIRANFFAVAAATAFSGLLASTGLTMAQLRERIIGDTESLHVLTIYRRAHDRGQIDLDHIPASVLTMPFDLVRHDMLMDFSPPTPTRIQSIVDELFLPLVSTAMEHTLSLGRPDGGRLCKRP